MYIGSQAITYAMFLREVAFGVTDQFGSEVPFFAAC